MSGATSSPGYIAYRAAHDVLQRRMEEAGARLAAIPGTGSGPMGLTPDHVKALPEWRAAYGAYWQAHKALAALNGRFVKLFRHELAEERSARREASRAAADMLAALKEAEPDA